MRGSELIRSLGKAKTDAEGQQDQAPLGRLPSPDTAWSGVAFGAVQAAGRAQSRDVTYGI